MTLKRKGEVELEAIYAGAPKGVTYTIVRPGGLTDGPVVGPKGETGRQLFSRTDEFCFCLLLLFSGFCFCFLFRKTQAMGLNFLMNSW